MKRLFDRQLFGVVAALVIVSLAAYWPVLRADFVNYDDQDYVTENSHVKAGLTWSGVKWAFGTSLMGSWHPVTWLSHMMDVQLFGMNSGAHHATSLVLHLANVLLLLVLFQRLTGDLWPSAVAAGLFALHPLHVESVAWVAERKDVLSAFFGLLSLLAYTRYARASTLNSPPSTVPGFARSPAYWLTALFLALGLMSKPMLVTWPILMLLLDWWPLRRITQPFCISSWKRPLVEKLPFVSIVVVVSVLTFFTQSEFEAVVSVNDLPVSIRLANIPKSVFVYVTQFFWPTNLAPFYPFIMDHGFDRLILPVGLLVGVCVLSFMWRYRMPFLGVGWAWYLVALLPVCGLIQVGYQAHADRYTYLPSIGLGLALVWGLAVIRKTCDQRYHFVTGVAVILLGILGWRTHLQARLWQSTDTLFRHALAVTSSNFIAHQGLGEEFARQGKYAEAEDHYRAALAISPNMWGIRNNLSVALMRLGRYDEAVDELSKVLLTRPTLANAYFNLGDAHERMGQFAEALPYYRDFLKYEPKDLETRLAVARCLTQLGQTKDAIIALQSLQQDFSTNAVVAVALAAQWQLTGKNAAALAEYERALQIAPDAPALFNNFAWFLATCPDAEFRNGSRAVQMAEQACRLTENRQAFLLGTLAAAYAEAGRFDDAVSTAQRAIALATAAGQTAIASRNAELLELYRAGKSYRESAR